MPVVNIDTWPMKAEQKAELIKKVTEAFASLGVPAQAVTVLIRETPLENWGSGGEQHSIKYKDLRR